MNKIQMIKDLRTWMNAKYGVLPGLIKCKDFIDSYLNDLNLDKERLAFLFALYNQPEFNRRTFYMNRPTHIRAGFDLEAFTDLAILKEIKKTVERMQQYRTDNE